MLKIILMLGLTSVLSFGEPVDPFKGQSAPDTEAAFRAILNDQKTLDTALLGLQMAKDRFKKEAQRLDKILESFTRNLGDIRNSPQDENSKKGADHFAVKEDERGAPKSQNTNAMLRDRLVLLFEATTRHGTMDQLEKLSRINFSELSERDRKVINKVVDIYREALQKPTGNEVEKHLKAIKEVKEKLLSTIPKSPMKDEERKAQSEVFELINLLGVISDVKK